MTARNDEDRHGVDEMIEVTAEQAAALSLSSIAQALSNLYTALENGLPGPK